MRARMIVILAFFFVYLPNGLQTGVVSMVVVVTVSCSQNQPDTVSNFTAQRAAAAAAACVLEKYLFEKGSIRKYNVEYLHTGFRLFIIARLLRYFWYWLHWDLIKIMHRCTFFEDGNFSGFFFY